MKDEGGFAYKDHSQRLAYVKFREETPFGAGLTTVEHTTQIVMKIAQAVGGAEANPDRHLLMVT